jgi:hypothetical protein
MSINMSIEVHMNSFEAKQLQGEALMVANEAHHPTGPTIFTSQSHGVVVPMTAHQLFEQQQAKAPQVVDLGKLPKHGSFETDVPLTISKAKIQNGRLMCTVTWDKRPNGL